MQNLLCLCSEERKTSHYYTWEGQVVTSCAIVSLCLFVLFRYAWAPLSSTSTFQTIFKSIHVTKSSKLNLLYFWNIYSTEITRVSINTVGEEIVENSSLSIKFRLGFKEYNGFGLIFNDILQIKNIFKRHAHRLVKPIGLKPLTTVYLLRTSAL